MYKPYLKTGIIIILSIFVLISCDKECDCSNQNRLEFEDNSILLDKSILENWGEHVADEAYDGYRLILGAFSPEVSIHYSDSDVDSLSGRGHGIIFELFASAPNNFNTTDFTYSADHTVGTFSFGLVYYDFLFNHDDWLDEEFINKGNLSLAATNGVLELKYTGSFESGEKVTANYSGDYIFMEIVE